MILLLVLALSCASSVAEPAGDVEAITRTARNLSQAVIEMDAAQYAAQFAEDAVVLPPGRAAVEGRKAIREWADGWAAGTTRVEPEAEPSIDEVRVLGDWAFARTTVEHTIRAADREPRRQFARLLLILERQADGSWKISRYVWNTRLAES